MKNVHKLLSVLLALTLTAVLLAGCQVTSPDDPAFRKDWEESMDEARKDLDEAREEAKEAWGNWNDSDHAKDHRWEVQDANGKTLYTIDADKAVKTIDDLLSDEDGKDWKFTDEDPGGAACSYIYCQEKTLLAGQDPEEEREYENLMRFTVSKEKDMVTMTILEDMEEIALIPGLENLLTFSAAIPAETAETLRNPEQFSM